MYASATALIASAAIAGAEPTRKENSVFPTFETSGARIDTLKGDVAEFWHAGTFNINAAINSSKNRVQVDRSHDFGSADITGINFDAEFGLKYYKNGASSAEQQAKSIFQRF